MVNLLIYVLIIVQHAAQQGGAQVRGETVCMPLAIRCTVVEGLRDPPILFAQITTCA